MAVNRRVSWDNRRRARAENGTPGMRENQRVLKRVVIVIVKSDSQDLSHARTHLGSTVEKIFCSKLQKTFLSLLSTRDISFQQRKTKTFYSLQRTMRLKLLSQFASPLSFAESFIIPETVAATAENTLSVSSKSLLEKAVVWPSRRTKGHRQHKLLKDGSCHTSRLLPTVTAPIDMNPLEKKSISTNCLQQQPFSDPTTTEGRRQQQQRRQRRQSPLKINAFCCLLSSNGPPKEPKVLRFQTD